MGIPTNTTYHMADKLDPHPDADPIHIKRSHKGLLHKELGVPQGQPIPDSKLEAAAHSSDPAERKRAQFAINAKKFNH